MRRFAGLRLRPRTIPEIHSRDSSPRSHRAFAGARHRAASEHAARAAARAGRAAHLRKGARRAQEHRRRHGRRMSELKTSFRMKSLQWTLGAFGGGAGVVLGIAGIRAMIARPEFLPQLLSGGFLGFSALIVGMVI